MGTIGGQASGDFTLSNSALRILYSYVKDSIPALAADALTQDNPNVITTAAAVSTTLPANVKKGALGGSVAFVRPDAGTNTVGGAVATAGPTYTVNTRPLGIFINDAVGNAFENTPGVASGKGPFVRGGAIGTKIYETALQTTNSGGSVGDPITYSEGQFVYASVNGYLTNDWQDSYEFGWIDGVSGSGGASAALEPDVMRVGIVLSPPDANSTEMFVELLI
jgi:hypothetical protein